jgi:hypothetical protein
MIMHSMKVMKPLLRARNLVIVRIALPRVVAARHVTTACLESDSARGVKLRGQRQAILPPADGPVLPAPPPRRLL